MSRPISPSIYFIAAATLMSACAAPAGLTSGPAGQERAGRAGSQGRVLSIATRIEVKGLLPKTAGGADPYPTTNAFNAALTLNDDSGSGRPYLAEALPQLNTDTWRVFADGRMETTYKLRPGLTWHDGQPLEAEDFVFAQRVYTSPSLGIFPLTPQNVMEAVVAADPRTLVIRWRSPYPDAANVQSGDLDPLPRHILGQAFASLEQDPAGAADAFLSLPYWRFEYIGAGPYKLVHWEPGSYFEGVGFAGYALGRPKIDRLIVRIIPDDTAMLTNLLAGALDWGELRFEGGRLLERDWVPADKGLVIAVRGSTVFTMIQQRPEYVGHPALLDLRVQRALAHSIDRQAINDGVFEGQGFMTETIVPGSAAFYPEVDRAIMHYPYDPRRTEQLMNEAGFAKDRDGFFVPASSGSPARRDANTAGERFGFDFQRVNGVEFEQAQLIMTETWRRAGVEARPSGLPSVQLQDFQQRLTFPGIAMKGGGGERSWISAEIGTPDNRWVGSNTAGWSNPEYDRLYEAITTTLDQTERTRQFTQMQRLLSEQLPAFFLYFGIDTQAHVAALLGPKGETSRIGNFTPGTLRNWNIHEWEFR